MIPRPFGTSPLAELVVCLKSLGQNGMIVKSARPHVRGPTGGAGVGLWQCRRRRGRGGPALPVSGPPTGALREAEVGRQPTQTGLGTLGTGRHAEGLCETAGSRPADLPKPLADQVNSLPSYAVTGNTPHTKLETDSRQQANQQLTRKVQEAGK